MDNFVRTWTSLVSDILSVGPGKIACKKPYIVNTTVCPKNPSFCASLLVIPFPFFFFQIPLLSFFPQFRVVGLRHISIPKKKANNRYSWHTVLSVTDFTCNVGCRNSLKTLNVAWMVDAHVVINQSQSTYREWSMNRRKRKVNRKLWGFIKFTK